jgi:large repetitive protein
VLVSCRTNAAPLVGTLTNSSVLANDSDAENDSLTAILVTGPAHAISFVLNPDGTFVYVHNGTETTTDSFTYKANDGTLDSNVATVTITVIPVNHAPTVVPDLLSVSESFIVQVIALLANDSDIDGDPLTVFACSDFLINTTGVEGDVTAKLPGLTVVSIDLSLSDGTPCAWIITTASGGVVDATLASDGILVVAHTAPAFTGLEPNDVLVFTSPYTISDGNGGLATDFFHIAVTGE